MRRLLGGSSRASWAFVALTRRRRSADVGREGEIGYLDEIDSSPLTMERMIRKLRPNKCLDAVVDRADPVEYIKWLAVGTRRHARRRGARDR
jgi:hypothetical protein